MSDLDFDRFVYLTRPTCHHGFCHFSFLSAKNHHNDAVWKICCNSERNNLPSETCELPVKKNHVEDDLFLVGFELGSDTVAGDFEDVGFGVFLDAAHETVLELLDSLGKGPHRQLLQTFKAASLIRKLNLSFLYLVQNNSFHWMPVRNHGLSPQPATATASLWPRNHWVWQSH